MKKNINSILTKVWQRLLYPVRPYWTANIYGFGKWIRRYGYYPPVLPLCIYTDHGPRDSSVSPYPHELDSDAPVQFYHAISNVERWKNISTKSCYPLYSPFVFARRILGIEQSKDANGTIFFVAHSTPSISENKPIERYHEEISALPDRFKPITICLHIHDVRKGLDKEYIKLGYKVVTAGDSLNKNFTEKFYRLLVNQKYALSNIFGSYALYCVEMGVPFGLYGTEPLYVNKEDPNVEKGEYKSYKKTSYYKRALELFGNLPEDMVSKEQYEFAAYHLGIESGVSRIEMMKILYSSLLMWLLHSSVRLVKRLSISTKG